MSCLVRRLPDCAKLIRVRSSSVEIGEPVTGPKSTDGQEINLPPGKYKISLKLASGAAQNREFELAADETWGLVAGQAGVPLPLRIY